MNNGVLIRDAVGKDVPEIAKLNEMNLVLFINQDVLKWQSFERKGYDTNFFVVAEKDGHIIGSQALIPIRMIGNKRLFLSGKSECTLIHKSFRGQGIFEKMYSRLFEAAERHGINVVWGFTEAIKAFSKMGFTVPAALPMGYISLDLNDNFKFLSGKLKKYYGHISYIMTPLLMIYLLLKRIQLSACLMYYGMKYHSYFPKVRELTKADEDFSRLLSIMNEKNQSNGVITIYRDITYMNWRIFNNPRINYKILMYSDGGKKGYIIFYTSEGILWITDYYCTTVDTVFPLLLNRALRYGLKNRCWCVRFLDHESSENQKYTKYFRFYSSMRFKNLNPMVLKIIGDGLIEGEQDIGKWFITEIFSQGT